MSFVRRVLDLVRALNTHRVDYVVVGGVAMNIHGFARATEDVNVFIKPTEANVDDLKRALFDVWHDEDISGIQASDLLGEYPVIRYGPPDDFIYVDVMTRVGERVSYSDLESQRVEVQGVSVIVASPRTLFEMKRDTLRPIDRDDARRLADAFGFEE